MQQFKLIVKIPIVNGIEHYHARMDSWHGDHWTVVGILVLNPAEWAAYMDVCAAADIEITYEQRAAVHA